jgi:hypothetical protein
MDQEEKMSKNSVVGETLNVQTVGFMNLKGSIIIRRPYSVHSARQQTDLFHLSP